MKNDLEYKCYIVLREDLQMPLGKFAVQVGHAMDQVWTYYMPIKKHSLKTDDEELQFEKWYNEGRRKIVLKTKNIESLSKLEDKLRAEGTKYFEIKDLGLNFFNDETITGLVLYPTDKELKSLKRLQCW